MGHGVVVMSNNLADGSGVVAALGFRRMQTTPEAVDLALALRDMKRREPRQKLKRSHLTSQQDAVNVRKEYGISQSPGFSFHSNDVISAETIVSTEKEYLLFYKPQGRQCQDVEVSTKTISSTMISSL